MVGVLSTRSYFVVVQQVSMAQQQEAFETCMSECSSFKDKPADINCNEVCEIGLKQEQPGAGGRLRNFNSWVERRRQQMCNLPHNKWNPVCRR
jgi:hypothetical protein